MTVTQWIHATWIGWLTGMPLVVLLALVGEALGIGGAQFLVGAGMGAGVGFWQGRALRPILGRAAPWGWSCAIGLLPPFLLADGLRAMGRESYYSVQLAVAVGGVVTGTWQACLLHAHTARSAWWIPASTVGWTLAALASGAADVLGRAHALRGLGGALAYLGITAGGGLVLGTVTGVVLVRLLGQSRFPGVAAGSVRE